MSIVTAWRFDIVSAQVQLVHGGRKKSSASECLIRYFFKKPLCVRARVGACVRLIIDCKCLICVVDALYMSQAGRVLVPPLSVIPSSSWFHHFIILPWVSARLLWGYWQSILLDWAVAKLPGILSNGKVLNRQSILVGQLMELVFVCIRISVSNSNT
jgi:hypothetical protein